MLTDLPPEDLGVTGMAAGMDRTGISGLEEGGWQWPHSRPTGPDRVARRWLVLVVATLWVLACGTRVEDAAIQGRPPSRLRTLAPTPLTISERSASISRA